MVCSHRCSAEEGISVSSLRRGRKFGTSPRILRSFYTCAVESILTGCITAWFGNSTAGNAGLCKGSCELPATLLEVSFPPSRISTPGGVQGKPGGLSKTPATRPTDCSLLPSGRRFRSIRSRKRLRDSFFLRLSG